MCCSRHALRGPRRRPHVDQIGASLVDSVCRICLAQTDWNTVLCALEADSIAFQTPEPSIRHASGIMNAPGCDAIHLRTRWCNRPTNGALQLAPDLCTAATLTLQLTTALTVSSSCLLALSQPSCSCSLINQHHDAFSDCVERRNRAKRHARVHHSHVPTASSPLRSILVLALS